MRELTGKVAIVTGASRGIGAATARVMAVRGAKLLLAARTSGEIEEIAAEIRDAGGEALAVPCDVASWNDVSAMVARCEEVLGGVDILVNNAGLIDPIAMLADSDPAEWDKVVDVNLKGVYHGIRAVAPGMRARGGGVIVNISSGAATGALDGWSHYCATKAAVFSLTRCADQELRGDGIRVVGLSPGTVATHMQVAIKASGINPVSRLDPSVHIPPEWVGQGIAWLCTEDAAEFAGTDVSLRDEEIRHRAGVGA